MICGCTPDEPCRLQDGDECCWLKPWVDCCSRPSCLIAYGRLLRRGAREIDATRRDEREKGLKARREQIVRAREGKGQRHRRRNKVKGRAA